MKARYTMKSVINWRPLSDPPKESGPVLLAMTHHDIPMVVMGFCRARKEAPPSFKEPYYNGMGVQMHFWAKPPKHPMLKGKSDGN